MESQSRVQNVCQRMRCSKTTKPTCHSWAWSIAVVVAFISMAVINVLGSREFGSFGGGSNPEVSGRNPTFLTPDGMTFSIWSVIFFFEALFCLYQIIPAFQNSHAGVSRARFWVVLLFLCNIMWSLVFAYEYFWLSLMIMLLMDVSLVMIYRMMVINYGAVDRTQGADMFLPSIALEHTKETLDRLKLEDTDQVPAPLLHPWPVKVICFVGFSANLSWLAVATGVNLLVAMGPDGYREAFEVVNATGAAETVYVYGSEQFAVMAVCLCALIAILMAVRNADVPYALAAMWALGGVYRSQSVKPPTGFPGEAMSAKISSWAVAMIITIGIAAIGALVKAVIESLAARSSAPATVDYEAGRHLYTEANKSTLYTDEKSGVNYKDASIE